MATTAIGNLIVRCANDQYQASTEVAVCLASVSGDDTGIAIFDFVKEDTFEDTVS